MADKVINVEIKTETTGLKSLKQELRETVQALQQIPAGSAEFEAMANKAAMLKDRMAEVNEQVNALATGSKYEKVTKAFGEMGAGLADMDFDRVVSGADLFAKSAKAITFKDAIGSVKQMGQAFITVGKAILTSPLFLLVGVITLIVVGIVKLLDKMGILKDVMDAVGYVIDLVVQGLKDFSDWLGLTSFAAEDAADRQAAAAKTVADAYERKSLKVVAMYDQEIRMAELDGERTVEMEIQKATFIKKTAIARAEEYKMAYQAAELKGDLDKAELEALKRKFVDQVAVARKAQDDIDYIRKKDVVDTKKANDATAAENRAAQEKRAEAARKAEAERQRLAEEERKRLLEAAEFEKAMNEGLMVSLKAIDDKIAADEQAKKDKEAADLEAASAFRIELMNFELAEEQRIDEERKKADEERKLRNKQIADASVSVTKGALQGAADLVEAFAGKSLAAQQRAFEAQKKLNIAMSIIDTIKGGISAFNGMVTAVPGPVGIALGIAAAAGVVASGIANIKKISSTKLGQTSISGGGAPNIGSSSQAQQPATPNVSLFGQNNNANNLSSNQQTQTQQQPQVITAVVVESEITTAQAKVKGMQMAASL